MEVINYTELRKNLKETLDQVSEEQVTYIVHRGMQQNAVIISLAEYNSMRETLHLISNRKNAEVLFDSIDQAKRGEIVYRETFEQS
jgi:antitoxin YefM